MSGLPLYLLVPFDRDGKELPTRERYAPSDAAIVGRAGTLAKANDGPVDVARAGDGPWEDRYITTVSPSVHHAKGYRSERLT